MSKYCPENERMKRDYTFWLETSNGKQNATIDAALRAIERFEHAVLQWQIKACREIGQGRADRPERDNLRGAAECRGEPRIDASNAVEPASGEKCRAGRDRGRSHVRRSRERRDRIGSARNWQPWQSPRA